jgi:hypothetical protein
MTVLAKAGCGEKREPAPIIMPQHWQTIVGDGIRKNHQRSSFLVTEPKVFWQVRVMIFGGLFAEDSQLLPLDRVGENSTDGRETSVLLIK